MTFHVHINFFNELGSKMFDAKIETLLEVISAGSYTRAAQRLSLTQPAVSHHMRQLEQEFGILTRCGLHCAPAAHRSLGTFPQGTIRFSLGFANTEQDVDAAVAALRAISAG